jgi:hypothetical protein
VPTEPALPTSVSAFRNRAPPSAVVVSYPSVDYGHPDRFPLSVLDLFSGQGGRLFWLRDRQSLAYSVRLLLKGSRAVSRGYIADRPRPRSP